MGDHHHTKCTNNECRQRESQSLKVGIRCPHCKKGKRQRDPKVPSLFVKRIDTREIVSIIPVKAPYSTVKGYVFYQVVMSGMLHQMDTERFLIDDSEFPGAPEGSETVQAEEEIQHGTS